MPFKLRCYVYPINRAPLISGTYLLKQPLTDLLHEVPLVQACECSVNHDSLRSASVSFPTVGNPFLR